MILAAVASVLIAPGTAAEFFPLTPGTKWTYASMVGTMASEQVDEALAPVEIGGELATPIQTKVQNRVVGTSYYRVSGDTVFLLAEDPKKPYATPMPIFKVGEGRTSWKSEGSGSFMGSLAPFVLKGESNLKREWKFPLGPKDTFEVKMETIIGTNEKAAIRGKQSAYYAKGIGLIEMLSEQKVNGQTSKMTLKLLKFEVPESGG